MEKHDKDYLKTYVHSFKIISTSKPITISCIETKKLLFLSQPLLKLLKSKSSELEGKKLRDIKQMSPYIVEYLELEKKLIQKGGPISALIAHDFENTGTRSAKLLCKEPLINPLTRRIVGVVNEIKDFLINHEFSQFMSLMEQKHGKLATKKINKPISLTKRQQEIIFLLGLGKSPKNIAEFISKVENKILSPATVTAIINKHLYLKFGVNSTSELIQTAILLGYVNNIPSSFIRKSGVLMLLD